MWFEIGMEAFVGTMAFCLYNLTLGGWLEVFAKFREFKTDGLPSEKAGVAVKVGSLTRNFSM